MLSYPDGTEIKMGDVIPADKISEVQMTAADDGISIVEYTGEYVDSKLDCPDTGYDSSTACGSCRKEWKVVGSGAGRNQPDNQPDAFSRYCKTCVWNLGKCADCNQY